MIRRLVAAIALSLVVGTACGLEADSPASAQPSPSIVTRSEFEEIFPTHLPFYTYDDFAAHTTFRDRREAAMLLANVYHETLGLTLIDEDPRWRRGYCDLKRRIRLPGRCRTSTSVGARSS